jgi:hypothetical protein
MRRLLLLLTVAAVMAAMVVSIATSAGAKPKEECPPGYTADNVEPPFGPGPGCYGPDVTGQKVPICPPPGRPVEVGDFQSKVVCYTEFVKHGDIVPGVHPFHRTTP